MKISAATNAAALATSLCIHILPWAGLSAVYSA
jgi:hypothetical protein